MSNNILKALKVLLVEDENNLATLLKNAIGDNFNEFIIASNGKEGIEKYHQHSPNIIITDIMMPELNGLEMAKELKKIDPKVQIIILSAFSDTEKLLNAIDIGVIKYFIKPFDPEELLEYILSISSELNNTMISLIDGFKFNKMTHNLYKDNKYIAITKRESKCLQLLLKNIQKTINDKFLKTTLWENEDVSDERLRTFIKRFRIKTSKNLIQNIKGRGYQIVLQ
ncbi:MAG: response regulator transcription factor [Arcobacteraceae bacterium]|nr:response regulator transcription factor [Arcobacteraceae bacterium]